MTTELLYQDSDFVVVNKAAGLVSDRTPDPDRQSAVDTAAELIANPSAQLRAGHRLDKATSGVLVLAKSKASAAWFSQLLQERKVDKIYRAIVLDDKLPGEFTVRSRLKHHQGRTRTIARGGQLAITDFCVLARQNGRTLLEVRPRSGRTHQIRVHLADRGTPIIGDTLYGGDDAPRLMLHAWRLSFEHEAKRYEFEAPLPCGFA